MPVDVWILDRGERAGVVTEIMGWSGDWFRNGTEDAMDFQIKLDDRPKPLVVKVGEAGFTMHHKYLDAGEKMEIVEAMASGGLQLAQERLWKRIDSWEGVKNADGSPLPIRRVDADGKEVESNIPLVIGRVPWAEQLRVLFAQMALNGIRFSQLEKMIAAYLDPAEVAPFVAEIDAFLGRAGGKAGRSSNASAPSETSTT